MMSYIYIYDIIYDVIYIYIHIYTYIYIYTVQSCTISIHMAIEATNKHPQRRATTTANDHRQAQGGPKMGGADQLETAPFLAMEPKTWPTDQQSWPVTQPAPTWDVFHLWPLDHNLTGFHSNV